MFTPLIVFLLIAAVCVGAGISSWLMTLLRKLENPKDITAKQFADAYHYMPFGRFIAHLVWPELEARQQLLEGFDEHAHAALERLTQAVGDLCGTTSFPSQHALAVQLRESDDFFGFCLEHAPDLQLLFDKCFVGPFAAHNLPDRQVLARLVATHEAKYGEQQ